MTGDLSAEKSAHASLCYTLVLQTPLGESKGQFPWVKHPFSSTSSSPQHQEFARKPLAAVDPSCQQGLGCLAPFFPPHNLKGAAQVWYHGQGLQDTAHALLVPLQSWQLGHFYLFRPTARLLCYFFIKLRLKSMIHKKSP